MQDKHHVRSRSNSRILGPPGPLGLAFRLLSGALLSVAAAFAPAESQAPPDPPEEQWLVGGSVGFPGYQRDIEPSLFTLAFHASYVPENSIGMEAFVGTMPRALFEGIGVLGARANLVAALGSSAEFLLLPTAGVSFIGGAGGGGGGATFGLNGGIGFLALNESSAGIRVGVTWHRFGQDGFGVWLLEFGFVR